MTATARRSLRCAIYTRVSTESGLDQDFNSLDAQFDAADREGPDGGAAWLLAAAEAAEARLLEDHAAFLQDPGVVAELSAPTG